MTKLSIIIPHYNSSALLEKLILTIPNNPAIQVIVIDDHSDKRNKYGIKKIKEKFMKRNILFLNNDINKNSAGACRNIGLRHAVGEWVIFADADDYFLNGFWENIETFLYNREEVIFFKPISIELDSGKPSDRHLPLVKLIDDYLNKKDSISENKLRYFFVSPISKMIKLEFLKDNNIKFDEVIASNDVMFSTKVGYYMEDFIVSEKEIYCITRSKGSLTTTVNEEIFDARISVFINQYKFLKKYCLTKHEFKKLKSKMSGRSLLAKSIDMGISKSLWVLFIFQKNRIHIVDSSLLNPFATLRRGVILYNMKFKNKRFNQKI